ncbi:MAG TPA: 30S ribosome-binding factor RbfA [Syntrophales bacterium]|jgi:ribosome-binding factor A|nr:30S ribosome-binding factor RbfA [Syntrophales bacterium]HOX95516.1 30S ribosome-binding factor RbfA [Syntrophales bacterium]HPI57689.1 30S ribosome-binding factor RbfA [Syntrophales bacterium]HPN23922.1 30S ribosome-binding factor RbfA [Syntrophales bacterium]HQM28200.1 30S ribosome-binding factor RbfA [Syntrophales bacterium]
MTFKRADRVADLIKAELSDILLRRIRDPRIGLLTITDVKMSDDLRSARIYFVQMGKDRLDAELQAGLEKARGYLKRELGKRLNLRYMPDVFFFYDKSFEYGSRIDRLLMEIHEKDGKGNPEDH